MESELVNIGRHLQKLGDVAPRLNERAPSSRSLWTADGMISSGTTGEGMVRILIVTSGYHLRMLGDSLAAGNAYPVGPYTLLRGAAESSARAIWLTDTALDINERRGRYFAERLANLREQLRDPIDRDRVKERIQEVVATAKMLGHQPVYGKDRDVPTRFEVDRPSITRLLTSVLSKPRDKMGRTPGQLLYHYLSGNAHGVVSALIKGMQHRPGEAGKRLVRFELQAADLCAATALTVVLYRRAVRAMVLSMGLREEILNEMTSDLVPLPAFMESIIASTN